ncbi:MAG: tryptophan--tRNA ligase [Actinobacteria bacterium]|nr:tryptophan--tRNA ligase [Actinomycetota bacterium]MCI0544875.1 tryptophan--tRNA ligase [Actinomycetota bacterium]MCI0677481.1 tryptophan--tRNA ligase [Actinomycetota bacterium]
MTERRRVFSGAQPTGEPHIGNLIGALNNWVAMQDDYDTVYCVVDLHAMTVPYVPSELEKERRQLAKMVLSVGVDPSRSLFYYQSDVPQHVELAWVLTTLAGVGQLERMTQYKEKSDRTGQSFGLLAYPVLMAADILVHKAHAVPVGDDQTQHLELTRDLAERFNSRYGELFPIPERITPEIGARVMSLTEPTSKMSKSDPSPRSRILLTDDDDQIVAKVRAAVTDTGAEVAYDWTAKPGISNLLEIYSFFTGRPIPDLIAEHRDGGYGAFKEAVAQAVAEGIRPIRKAYEALSDEEVAQVMSVGAERGRELAEGTMMTVREAVGLS